MTKRKYYNLCLNQPTAWLIACANNPSPSMSATHIRIIKLVVRKREGK